MLNCPKCNYDNELGRIFCHQCGAKLDLDSIKPPSRGGKSLRKRKEMGFGKIIGWAARILILGGLVVVLVLMALVPEHREISTTPKDLESFYRKRSALSNAMMSRRALEIKASEAELNAYVNSIQFDKPTGKGIAVEPVSLHLEFGADTVMVVMLGKIKVREAWEKRLAISYTGVPTVSGGKFTLEPRAARFGKLPIPLIVLKKTGFMQGYFQQVFGKLTAEQQLLDRLSAITLDDASVILAHKPAAPAS